MRKSLLIVVISVIVGLGVWMLKQVQHDAVAPAGDKPLVKIGAILPLTGNIATWGQSYNSGILLAYDDIKGDTKFNYKMIVEDHADDIKNLPAIISKLLNIDKVDSVITIFNPTANVVSPIFTQNKKIHMGGSWFPDFIGNKYNFNFYSAMEDESDVIVKKANKEGYKNVVLFTTIHTGFISGTKILKQKLAEGNIKVCKEIEFNFGQRDFRMEIAKAQKECSPDLFIIGAFPPESDILIKQIKEVAGKNVAITGLDLGLNVTAYGLYEGLWFPAPTIPNEDFISKYVKKYNKDDYLFGAGIGYDELSILVEAYENARADNTIPTPDEVSDYIHHKARFNSVFGKVVVEDSGQVNTPVDMIMIKNGKPVVVTEGI